MKVLITCNLPQEVIGSIKKQHHVDVNQENRPMDRKRLLQSVGNKDGLLCTITD
ncbi:MAG: D-glycerate dehydrogenase, partial [Desulfobacterales bacterium]|nr:D-glycerate dehydrogenase [Desulfobacterales bacterium]